MVGDASGKIRWFDPCERYWLIRGNGTTSTTMHACSWGPVAEGRRFARISMATTSCSCGHIHAQGEWARSSQGLPTNEEAEYTPSLVFTLAIATAWASLSLAFRPSRPQVTYGHCRRLSRLCCRWRSWPFICGFGHMSFVPGWRRQRSSTSLGNQFLVMSMWAQVISLTGGPWGHGVEVVVKYVKWLQNQSGLSRQVEDLRGKVLVTLSWRGASCPGMAYPGPVWLSGRSRPSMRQVLALASGTRLTKAMPVHYSQEAVVAAFCSICSFTSW